MSRLSQHQDVVRKLFDGVHFAACPKKKTEGVSHGEM